MPQMIRPATHLLIEEKLREQSSSSSWDSVEMKGLHASERSGSTSNFYPVINNVDQGS